MLAALRSLAGTGLAIVDLYDNPRRLHLFLKTALIVFGNRPVADSHNDLRAATLTSPKVAHPKLIWSPILGLLHSWPRAIGFRHPLDERVAVLGWLKEPFARHADRFHIYPPVELPPIAGTKLWRSFSPKGSAPMFGATACRRSPYPCPGAINAAALGVGSCFSHAFAINTATTAHSPALRRELNYLGDVKGWLYSCQA